MRGKAVWGIVLATALIVLTVPGAFAGHEDLDLPTCASVTKDPTLEAGDYYLWQRWHRRIDVWEETNGADGLQTKKCTVGHDVHAPDTLRERQWVGSPSVPNVPVDPGSVPLPRICIPLLGGSVCTF